MNNDDYIISSTGRYSFILLIFIVVVIALLGRALYLQHNRHELLSQEGNDRQIRDVSIPAYRGIITDRNNKILAVSVPAYAACANPRHFNSQNAAVEDIARLLAIKPDQLRDKLDAKKDKQFVYIKRQLSEEEADNLKRLNIEGIELRREHRRLYPLGETTSHLVGVTDIDGNGIEGVEKASNTHLEGRSGVKRVLKDRYGQIINDIEMLEPPHSGKQLTLSIDQRIQYYAYRALKSALYKHRAQAGSILVMDVESGEILALANQPSFNPNDRSRYVPIHRRNRALTDEFEPGSVIKPFIVAALLEHGYMDLNDQIHTAGLYRVSGQTIRDIRNFGKLSLAEVIVKSSNIGISKAAVRLSEQEVWKSMRRLGFGQIPGTSFPGETAGRMRHYSDWHDTDQIIMSYGYGITVSVLQLASAYAAIANDGWMPHPSIYKLERDAINGEQIFKAETARSLKQLLAQVVIEGTGRKAQIPGFTVAGKTGTTQAMRSEGYTNEYISIFSGFAPVSNPKVVAVVVIDRPIAGEYYGGRVAAPIFSEVVENTLKILNVSEDGGTESYIPENMRYTWKEAEK